MALLSLTVEVLLVEDDPGDELMTREAFSQVGSRLHVVRDGEEALDFLHRRGQHRKAPRVDLVLLDLGLPKQDGRRVLAEIRDDPQLTHLPVVVLTGSNAESDIAISYQLHANAYITKPADLTQFADTIRRIDEFFLSVVQLPRA
jgi:CheY-like chemotaxis protein